MRLEVEATAETVRLAGIPFRVWLGKTEQGSECFLLEPARGVDGGTGFEAGVRATVTSSKTIAMNGPAGGKFPTRMWDVTPPGPQGCPVLWVAAVGVPQGDACHVFGAHLEEVGVGRVEGFILARATDLDFLVVESTFAKLRLERLSGVS